MHHHDASAALVLMAVFLPLTGAFLAPTKKNLQEPSMKLAMSSKPPPARQPWDFVRFVQQSSKFVPLPFRSNPEKTIVKPGDVLWSPGSPDNSFTMSPLDDVVMGGVSSSSFDETTGLWRGAVTDANNGGFIGIRSTPSVQWDLSECEGIQLKLRSKKESNKKQRFKVGLRDTTDFNGILWTTSVDLGGALSSLSPTTSQSITTTKVPLDKQVPTMFARVVPDKVFSASNVVGIQLVYSKFEYDGDLNPFFEVGNVELQVLEISAY